VKWLVVVAAACGGHRSDPPAPGSAELVIRDAAPRVTPDASVDAARDALVSTTLPDFGCFASTRPALSR
jgi:hypothetical protein